MKVGVSIRNTGDHPRRFGLVAMGQLAEEAGADSLWVSDHVLQVEGAQSRYPFSEDGRPWWPVDMPWWECLVSASFLAAGTERVRVGTAILVLPQRNALELAKTTATIDALSGGRLALGVGAGWHAEEMEALGYPFETRGRRMDEMLEVLRRCWSGRPEAFAGEQVELREGLVFEPRPARPGGPPLLIGGMGRAALRRAARRADGWLALQRSELLDYDELRRGLESLRELRAEAGREAEPFEAIFRLASPPEFEPQLARVGSDLRELGFDELIVEVTWDDPTRAASTITGLRDAVA